MNDIIDFTHAEPGFRDYGGSDSKLSVIYNEEHYMLKFPEAQTKTLSIQTSEANNVFSEYIGSHIIQSVGLPVHETFIGLYKDEPVVACKDFVPKGYKLQEFDWFSRNIFRKSELGRIPTYNQLYKTFENPSLQHVKQQGIQRYWDTFVMDALIGNFDRHRGNWGYLVNENTKDIQLAPIYDCGSSLYPGLAETSFKTILENQGEIYKRVFDFPKAALNKTDNVRKTEKYGYYELMSSNIDKNCIDALKRIAPLIDLEKINEVIDNTPIISDVRKNFYKEMVRYRKELILDRSLEIQFSRDYDKATSMPLDELINSLDVDRPQTTKSHSLDLEK